MPTLKVPRTTVNLSTGEEVTETVEMQLMPAPPGTCAECATDHPELAPHNATSMFYMYHFYAKHDRWPNWHDAMAHCSDDVKEAVMEVLAKNGVDVDNGKIFGPPKGKS